MITKTFAQTKINYSLQGMEIPAQVVTLDEPPSKPKKIMNKLDGYDILESVGKMKKPKLYLDPSVISFYFADDSPNKLAITRKFFEEEPASGKYDFFISNLTILELGNCRDLMLRDKLLKFVDALSAEVLALTEEAVYITEQFVQSGVIPAKFRDDALHPALALVHGMDYVVSWNFKHLVKPKTKKAARAVAIQGGYKEIEIITPEEVVESEDED